MNIKQIKKLFVAALMFLPATSMATLISQSHTLSFDMRGDVQSVNQNNTTDSQYMLERLIFPAFDPSLGTLVDFNLTLNTFGRTDIDITANHKYTCDSPYTSFGCRVTASATASLSQTFYGSLIFGGDNLDPLQFWGDTFSDSVSCSGSEITRQRFTTLRPSCSGSNHLFGYEDASLSFEDVLNSDDYIAGEISDLVGNPVELLLGRLSVLELTACQSNCSASTGEYNFWKTYDNFGEVTLSYIYEAKESAQVPTPGTLALLSMGMVGLVSFRHRQRKHKQ